MTNVNWQPLKLLATQFTANISALATLNPAAADLLRAFQPPETYFIRTEGDRVFLGTGDPIRALVHTLPPDQARRVLNKLYPDGKCTESLLIAGEDLGWLLNAVYRLPCQHAMAPGHRPPIYFLMRDIERMWAILHVQDWRELLADRRMKVFIGEDVASQLEESLVNDTLSPPPTIAFTLDQAIWPAGMSFESVVRSARQRQVDNIAEDLKSLRHGGVPSTPGELAERITRGLPLRILGVTSLYTTFLQYSMRDWLSGLHQLGHQTRMVIEQHDHQIGNRWALTRECAEFRPDLIVVIDHTRRTLNGVPDEIPVVTWVQDRVSNLFSKTEGQSQGPLDYMIGYSRTELTQQFCYPSARFMPAMMGVSDERLTPRKLTPIEQDRYGCDVSFVSHASTPADQIIHTEIRKQENPRARAMLDEVFQQLQEIYQAGESISAGEILETLIDTALLRHGLKVGREQTQEFFYHQVNNALFRHQAIRWVSELGVNLHLYGNGWESHPEFSRFAKGPAENRDQLPIICQASRINLQVTPFGAVHQRLLEGLTAGGFFLLKKVTADDLELILREMHTWCVAREIRSGAEMLARQDEQLRQLTDRYNQLGGTHPLRRPDFFFSAVNECALSGWTRTPNTLWERSAEVTFSNQHQLHRQISHFLGCPQRRLEISQAMRKRVLQTHTYRSISKRMLTFIADSTS